MATFDAVKARAVACELKLRMDTLYSATLPIYITTTKWELNRTDPFLPTPFEIRVQLENYQALELERLRLSEYVKELLGARIDDTLTYPTPPTGGGELADGTVLADGSIVANGEGGA